MRLEQWEIDEIKKSLYEVFGEDAKVYLFGSRVDNSKKGGDIDLYVVADDITYRKEGDFWILLQERLGEQKIDIIYAKDSSRSIEQTAIRDGVLL
jgi:predicted nucleotidyltransferase